MFNVRYEKKNNVLNILAHIENVNLNILWKFQVSTVNIFEYQKLTDRNSFIYL